MVTDWNTSWVVYIGISLLLYFSTFRVPEATCRHSLTQSRCSTSSQGWWMGLRSRLCAGQSSSYWENHFLMELVFVHGDIVMLKQERDKLLPQSWKHTISIVRCSQSVVTNVWAKLLVSLCCVLESTLALAVFCHVIPASAVNMDPSVSPLFSASYFMESYIPRQG